MAENGDNGDQDKKKMTREEAARMGGEARKSQDGREGYHEMGQKGGKKRGVER